MTEAEKLQRDIDGLREANSIDRQALGTKPLTSAERAAIQRDIARRDAELADLIRRRDAIASPN